MGLEWKTKLWGRNGKLANAIVPLLTFGALFPLLFIRLSEAQGTVFWLYSFSMTGFLLFLYLNTRDYRPVPDMGLRPYLSVIIPIKNEEEVIEDVISTILASNYPSERLEVIAVNDGSSDNTAFKLEASKQKFGNRLTVVQHKQNFGKRVALASGMTKATGEIIVCIDSDSFVDVDALRFLVQPFREMNVVAVCGHGAARNKDAGILPKIQHYWYAEMFRIMKGMESKFGCVTCCSGILSAYRKIAIMPVLNEWLSERFAGRQILIGDDRQLTNLVSRGFDRFDRKLLSSPAEDRTLTFIALSAKDARVVYQSNAVVYTLVPVEVKQFLKQQLRWKRAWIHGSLLGGRFMWRKPWPICFTFYLYQFLTYMSPIVVISWLIVRPLQGQVLAPIGFLLGTLYIGFLHGLNTWKNLKISPEGIFYRVGFVFISLFLSLTILLYGWSTPWKGGWVTRSEKQAAVVLPSQPPTLKPLEA